MKREKGGEGEQCRPTEKLVQSGKTLLYTTAHIKRSRLSGLGHPLIAVTKARTTYDA